MEDGADGTTDVASHVAVEIDRAWCEDVTAALADVAAARPEVASSGSNDRDLALPFALAASGGEGKLAVVLERWWRRREARLDVATVPLGDADRAQIVASLADDDLFADLASTAPAVVRTGALVSLRRVAPRLARLAAIGAPGAILDGQRVIVARLLAELDPRAPREHEPTPAIGMAADAAGNEVVDLHAWLDRMLAAAVVDAPSVGLGDAFGERPEAVAFLAGNAAAPPVSVRVWPGLATLTVRPDLVFWASPAIALPQRIELPTTPPALVAAESSGPITYAVAGDTLGDALVPSLAERARGLARDRALLSFVWLDTESSGPWRPVG